MEAGKPSINTLSNGTIVLPISMSRVQNSQSATACHDMIRYFREGTHLDFLILYTDGLYLNNPFESAWAVKHRVMAQMLSHKKALERLILKKEEISLQAVHFMSWNDVVLAAPDYASHYQLLLRHARKDPQFLKLLQQSLEGREVSDASQSFILEETVITHSLRQQLVHLPSAFDGHSAFRLVVYPGPYIAADLYQWKHALLPQKRNVRFYASQCNFQDKHLYNFDEIEITADFNWQFEPPRNSVIQSAATVKLQPLPK